MSEVGLLKASSDRQLIDLKQPGRQNCHEDLGQRRASGHQLFPSTATSNQHRYAQNGIESSVIQRALSVPRPSAPEPDLEPQRSTDTPEKYHCFEYTR